MGKGAQSGWIKKGATSDLLRIDRISVQDMLTSAGDLAILQEVSDFTHAFECDLVADGVETQEHGKRLLKLG